MLVERRRIVLPYAPRDIFRPYHDRHERFAAIVAHRRCGKTVACVNDTIRRAVASKAQNGRYAYIAPLLSQSKEIAWDYLKRYSQPIQTKVNESELRVELLNGASIRLHGADNPDRLRGAYLDGVVLDEYADMRPSVWGEVVRPMLADRQGWATFIGTPKGRNDFWKIWSDAQHLEDWFHGCYKASETNLILHDELVAAAKDMTPEQYAQEFECSFDAAILGAYYAKEIAEAERTGRICDVAYDPLLPLHTAWDLGIGDSTAIWVFQVHAGEIRVLDFYENSGHALAHYAEILEARHWRNATHWVPHDAKVRELGTGRTRLETLAALNLKCALVPDHKVEDGINAVRIAFPRFWFDRTRTALGVEALRQYRTDYDEKLKAFKDKPRHDWTSHTADAFRYLAMAYREMAGEPDEPKPQLKPLPSMTYAELHEIDSAFRLTRGRV